MAGGLILVLGRGDAATVSERGIGSGIHGGHIFVRGDINSQYLGVGARAHPCTPEERCLITPLIDEYCQYFRSDAAPFLDAEYTRISPASSRPFANMYTRE
jgi:glutamate synthase domain-containing protein 3